MRLGKIKLLAIIAPIAGVTVFELFRHEVLHPALGETGPHIAEHVLSAIVMTSAILAFTFVVFRLLDRVQGQLLALNEAAVAVSSDLTLEGVLARVAELARHITGAPHATVRIDAPGSEAEVASGQPPLKGISRSIPIVARGRPLGQLVLTAPSDAGLRSADPNALAVFATQAGVAIENARLFEQVQELVRTGERERIGMDLHDGVVQELYGLGLKIEDAVGMLDHRPQEAARLLADARSGVRAVIGDVRTYVYDLRNGDQSVNLGEALGRVAQEFASAPLDVTVEVDGRIALPGGVAAHVVHVAREAVANAVQHAGASRALVRAQRRGETLVVEVSDDGRGFDPSAGRSGLGLGDMRDRASWCGATLDVDSAPGMGTTVRFVLPPRDDRSRAVR